MCRDANFTVITILKTESQVCPEEKKTDDSLRFKPEILVFLLLFYSEMLGEVVHRNTYSL